MPKIFLSPAIIEPTLNPTKLAIRGPAAAANVDPMLAIEPMPLPPNAVPGPPINAVPAPPILLNMPVPIDPIIPLPNDDNPGEPNRPPSFDNPEPIAPVIPNPLLTRLRADDPIFVMFRVLAAALAVVIPIEAPIVAPILIIHLRTVN